MHMNVPDPIYDFHSIRHYSRLALWRYSSKPNNFLLHPPMQSIFRDLMIQQLFRTRKLSFCALSKWMHLSLSIGTSTVPTFYIVLREECTNHILKTRQIHTHLYITIFICQRELNTITVEYNAGLLGKIILPGPTVILPFLPFKVSWYLIKT